MTIFFKSSEHTVRGMAGYAGKFHSMVSIYLHDCKEPDMVGLFDGNIQPQSIVKLHVGTMRDVPIALSQCDVTILPSRIVPILNFHALGRKFMIFEGARKGDDLWSPLEVTRVPH